MRGAERLLFFFIFQAIGRRLPSSHTYLVNALGATQEALIRGLTKDQKERARDMLAHADPADPITRTLMSLLDQMELVQAPPPGRLMHAARKARAAYDRVLRSRRFRLILVAIFVVFTLVSGIRALLGVTFADGLSIPEWAELLSNALVALLVTAGIVYLRRSRVTAYRWFLRGVLISLLMTQPFTFYREQFGALWWFGAGLLVWAVLRYMIELEETQYPE